MTKPRPDEDEDELIDRAALLAEINKIKAQRARARARAHRYYRPYASLSPSEKAKRLEYGRSYRQRQNAIIELGVELGVIEPPKRAAPVRRLPLVQEAQPRPSRALALVPRRRKA